MDKLIIKKSEFKKIFNFGINSSLILLFPYLAILINFKSLLEDLKVDREKSDKHKKEILNLIEYIDSNKINFNNFSDRQLKMINDLIKIFFQTVDDEKIDFILAYLKGVLSDKDGHISKYPIEPITRILRDISVKELEFLKKYPTNENKFIICSKKLSEDDYEKHIESVKKDGNIIIYFENDDFITFTGLINLGLVFCPEMYGSSFYYTETCKNFAECLSKLKEIRNQP